MSLALMNSKTTSAPSAFEASPAWRLSSTSQAGMKSTQRTILSRVPWAKAGARRAATMPSIPAAVTKPAAADFLRKVRRSTAIMDTSFRSSVRRSGLIDLLELAFCPLHGVLGLHALDALGVHVHDDVLRVGLGGFGRSRPWIAQHPRLARRLTEDLQGLVDSAPHRILLPHLGGANRIALVDLEPLSVVFLLVHPLEDILGKLLVLRILHDGVLEGAVQGELPGRPLREQRLVLDVLVEGLALLVLELVLLPLGHDVDGGAIEGRRDVARMEGAIVVGIIPGETALVAGVLPESLHELHGLDGALAVDHDLLAARVHLSAAEIPEERIGEGWRVTEAVAERLAHRLALGLELLSHLAPLVPRLRELLD